MRSFRSMGMSLYLNGKLIRHFDDEQQARLVYRQCIRNTISARFHYELRFDDHQPA